jgi:hypothetical protein
LACASGYNRNHAAAQRGVLWDPRLFGLQIHTGLKVSTNFIGNSAIDWHGHRGFSFRQQPLTIPFIRCNIITDRTVGL